MRTLSLFLILTFGTFCPLFSQSIGPDFDKTGTESAKLKEVVVLGDKGIATIVVDDGLAPKVFSIRFFNAQEELVEERQVTMSDEGLPAQIEGAFFWNDRLTILTSLYYPGPRRNNLLLRQYSIPTLEEVAAKMVDEAYTPADLRIPFGYSLSADKTRLLCYGWSYSLPEDPARLTIQVLDQELNSVWDQNYILPYKNETFYLYGCLIDPDDNVYVLCEDYQGSVSQFGAINEKKIKQVILYAGKDLKEPREYVIQSGKLTLTGVRFTLEPSGQLVGAGFYRTGNRSQYEGLITFRLDGAANKLDHNLTPIDKDAYKDAGTLPDGFRPAGANRYRFSDYSVDHLFVNDSIIYLAGEQIIEDPGNYPPFQFNDIFVARIRKGRYLDWIRRLPKRQEGFYDDLSRFSYNALQADDRILFIYNNVADRIEAGLGQTEIAEITPSGEVTRYDITRVIKAQNNIIPQPVRSWNFNNQKLLLYGEKTIEQTPQLMNIPWEVLLTKEGN